MFFKLHTNLIFITIRKNKSILMLLTIFKYYFLVSLSRAREPSAHKLY